MVPSIETYTAGIPRPMPAMPVFISTGFTHEKPNQEELQPDSDFSNYNPRTVLAQPRANSIRIITQKKEERPSRAYAELILRKKTNEMISLLDKLSLNLDTAEGARYMATFRSILSILWGLKDSLSKEKVLLISAVEEVVRGKKWRELTTGQIETIRSTLSQAVETVNSKVLSESLRTICRSGMDIFPSFDDLDFVVGEEDDDEEENRD